MATKTRTKKTAPVAVPAPPIDRQEDRRELDDVAALLEHPEAFREWLQSVPGDQILAPGKQAPQDYLQPSLWQDHLEHPITHWLRAIRSRGIWIDEGGTRYRLLCSSVWTESPAWLRGFARNLREVNLQQFEQAAHRCPTPARVLPILDAVLAQ